MRYWWVNQNQTYRHEVQGGYLWSPKRNANGAPNPFYESMREVAPGDLIFSFMDIGAEGNHWPNHWPATAPAVRPPRNLLKNLVGPGGFEPPTRPL
jgi:hypothetical protein